MNENSLDALLLGEEKKENIYDRKKLCEGAPRACVHMLATLFCVK